MKTGFSHDVVLINERKMEDIRVTNQLVFYVNGKKVDIKDPDPETTLLQYLRLNLGLTGSKLACGEGGCGACTVMVSKYDRTNKKISHISVNACLAPLCSMHGLAVTTVEGIGNIQKGLHPIQERLAKSHGTQCGFCTPGIIMSMYTLLRNNLLPSEENMERAFEGNLCRCTGYRPILEGFRTFTKEYCQPGKPGETCCRPEAPGETCCQPEAPGETCCRPGAPGETCCQIERCCCKNKKAAKNYITENYISKKHEDFPLNPMQDPIFPPELQNSDKFDREFIVFKGERVSWYRPVSLEQLLDIKHKYPEAKIVVGNTEIGIETQFKNMQYDTMIAPTHVSELFDIRHTDIGITFGGSVTLSTIEKELKQALFRYSEDKTRVFAAMLEMLRWFAGCQIRNVAAIAGNIVTASPISDLNPLLLTCGALLEVQSKELGRRLLTMNENFFTGYRKTALKPNEVIISISLPFTSKDVYFAGFKQSFRRADDIATVNAGMRVLFEDNTDVIREMSLAYGGMAATSVIPRKTMAAVVGRKWENSLVSLVCDLLTDDLPLAPDAPGGMVEYRRTLCVSLFFKFYLSVQTQLEFKSILNTSVPQSFQSAVQLFHRNAAKGSQVYEVVDSKQPKEDLVGRSINHLSAIKQTTGEAVFIDDMPAFKDEVHMVFVTSTKSFANIKSVNTDKALSMPGVLDFISYKDVPGNNRWGHVLKEDEEIFATKQVLCQGQIIGGIVAVTRVQAQRAAKCVIVEYEELQPIITIKEAIKSRSYHGSPITINCGKVENALDEADHVIESECHIGGQEHFYLETHSAIAVPKCEDGEMELFVSTQNLMDTQLVAAEALGVPANRIVVRVKRIGGGFGGKETRSIIVSTPAAIAANKLRRPVRVILDREEDMVMSGTRHPFYAKYKAGFTSSGKIVAFDVTMYNNAGMSMDLSTAVMERALYHSDNAYNIPNLRCVGYCCKTNIASNTAFRGFGGPQGMMVIEHCLTEAAQRMGVSPVKIRQMNLYQEGDKTFYEQDLKGCNLQKCWDSCLEQSDFYKRQSEIETFNRDNRWKKRGISVVPTKFGISYIGLHLNQSGALVHIYQDGSVLLSHGGVEMGQGLFTKMIQVASRALNIPASKIHTIETGTNTVPNIYATAASCGSDLNGMAVLNACQTLLARLEPVKKNDPQGSWEGWIKQAYIQRICLSAAGFYRTPGLGYDPVTLKGNPFNYFSYGVACSEVEIDCLTGQHQVLRTDIVMDVGASLNPAIDIGQIEGGFIQGYGLMMMEQQRISPEGFLHTRGPSTYKIPGFGDIPVEFNVSLLKGSFNPKAVYSSKAIGEPPLFLASSVFFAAKEAIMSAREDAGYFGSFSLYSPATPERIRMACVDHFTNLFPKSEEGTFKPWFVEL